MPVPVPTAEAPAPRRLLRDVVFDKMLAAIADGTLELGERLNDDELVRWLGVSRTPVREAIAKLAEYGLVDIEANRYTRIISPRLPEVVDTVRSALDIWSAVARRAVPLLTDAQKKKFVKIADDMLTHFDAKDENYGLRVLDLTSFLVEAAQSPSLARMEETVSSRAALLLRKASGAYQWSTGKVVPEKLKAAVKAGDADAAAAAFAVGDEWLEGWTERVRALAIFPEK